MTGSGGNGGSFEARFKKTIREGSIMFGIGPWELILILAIALIIFGPGKLPEIGKSLGKGIREFRKASENIKDEAQREAVK